MVISCGRLARGTKTKYKMKIKTEVIKKLRSFPILQVALDLGITFNHGRAICPFHPDTRPSLTYNRKNNTVKCYACGKSADTIALVMHVKGIGFHEACVWMCQNHSVATNPDQLEASAQPIVKKPYRQYPPDIAWLSSLVQHCYLNEEARHFLFEERKIDPRVVQDCHLSSINVSAPCYRGGRPFFDAPSLLIPYYDVNGTLLSIQSRHLGAKSEDIPRFRFPRNSNCKIYNQQILPTLQGDEPLFVAEGCSDAWSIQSAGFRAIAIPSATLLKEDELVALLSPFRDRWQGQLRCYPDADGPGEALYRKLLGVSVLMGITLVRHSLPEGCKDVSDMWMRFGRLV